jgi:hypothetical protein
MKLGNGEKELLLMLARGGRVVMKKDGCFSEYNTFTHAFYKARKKGLVYTSPWYPWHMVHLSKVGKAIAETLSSSVEQT